MSEPIYEIPQGEIQPEQTDNRPRPEDGDQALSQDPELDYSEDSL